MFGTLLQPLTTRTGLATDYVSRTATCQALSRQGASGRPALLAPTCLTATSHLALFPRPSKPRQSHSPFSFLSLFLTMVNLKALAISTFFFVSSLAASSNDWRSRSIYQVSPSSSLLHMHSCDPHQLVTDRFALTDGSGPACSTGDRVYCGGTYQGIIHHLDYIQNMGFDAIWISPVVSSFEGPSAYGEAYHGFVSLSSLWKSRLRIVGCS
jgi:hypothetical protein